MLQSLVEYRNQVCRGYLVFDGDGANVLRKVIVLILGELVYECLVCRRLSIQDDVAVYVW